MSKYCPFCGKDLREGAKFCRYCGKKIQDENVPQQTQMQSTATSPPPQQYSQPATTQPPTAPMQSKKPKKGLIIGLVAVVVVVIVLLLVFVYFFGGIIPGGNESNFHGTWESSSGFSTVELTFYKNKTYEFSSGFITETGTWKLNNDKLIIDSDMIGPGFVSANYEYEFTDDGNTLKLDYLNVPMYTFTKK